MRRIAERLATAVQRLIAADRARYIRRMSWSPLRLAGVAVALGALLVTGHLLARPTPGAVIERAEMQLDSTAVHDAAGARGVWQPFDDRQLATWRGPYRLRYTVQLGIADTRAPLGVHVALRGAFVATWDGRTLGTNGRLGADRAGEDPGRVDWMAPVPTDASRPGAHRLELFASTQHRGGGGRLSDARVRVGDYRSLVTDAYRAWLLHALALGALLAGWLYVAVIVVGSRETRPAALLLSVGASGALLVVVEGWRPLLGYAYPWHAVRLWTIVGLTAVTMGLLTAYMAARFPRAGSPERRPWGALAITIAAAAIVVWMPTFDAAAWVLHLLGLSWSLRLTQRALRATTDDSAPLLATLIGTTLVVALIVPGAYLDGLYIIALAVLMVVILLTHARALRDAATRALTLEVARARLTSALLRRSIQPHWLMNTLTSLQELIEREPARASRLVQLLADEFRLVTEASAQAVIPATQELALCRTHLGIVSMALPTPRALRVDGESLLDDVAVPPGILHTLLENGLTHGGVTAPREGGDFALAVAVVHDRLEFVFEAPHARRSRPVDAADVTGATGTSGASSAVAPQPVGTGSQFVASSLEAAFPSAWRFEQRPAANVWRSVISVPHAAARRLHAGLVATS